MKAKFFLCMRPTVIETEDVGDYIKLPPTVGSSYTTKTSGRRNRNKKRVVPERYIRQLSIRSTDETNSFSSNLSDGMPENPLEKEPQTPTNQVSGDVSFSSDKVNGGPRESNSGVYLMTSSLFFTIFLGKFFGILCTLILVYSLNYPHRKSDGNDGRRSENVVVKLPEKGSPEEYNKRVIMEGLLERKSHHRENIKNVSC